MTEHRAVDLATACELLGLSLRTGRRRLREGTFPIPEQPRLGRKHLFSTFHINHWLTEAATTEVANSGRRHRRWGTS